MRDDRVELGRFLRARRGRITPEDVGLVSSGRRRTSGLRREEVAHIASVSHTWYTWLEQGREVRASRQVLGSIADALRLHGTEREYLFRLAGYELPVEKDMSVADIPASLRTLVEHLSPHPAYLLGPALDVLLWNRSFAEVFGNFDKLPSDRRNLALQVFTDPRSKDLIVGWESVAKAIVGQLRTTGASWPDNPRFRSVIAELTADSPRFRAWWEAGEVAGGRTGVIGLRHPRLGELEFEHTTLVPYQENHLWLEVYVRRTPSIQATRSR
ncbi:helix-turn-helix transcriptional regulator [Pseudonocardia acaciae]|uniref:helix-turn-helix transcriptional regulator n=1 Tax=Pseudonocardia acaciae TaxID=551276 RepID=UPI0006845EC5|nr:helix-turn-helix transcriptional regulator [Pseudonocardia acaciae]